MRPTFLFLAAATAALAASWASAATFSVGIGSPVGTPACTPAGVSSGPSATPVARELACAPIGGGSVLDAQAAALFGHVGGSSLASHSGGYFGTAFGIGTTSEFVDFITFTSTDPLATSTTIAGNMVFSGALNVTEAGNAFVNAIWTIDGLGGGNLEISDNSAPFNRGFEVVSGFISNTSNNALLRTRTFNAPLNTPLRLTLFLSTSAGVAGAGDPQSGSASFSNSFEVPFGIDAFVLPAGVTANSGTWLVNNRRVGAVPEPASWAMMIVGFALSGVALRRRGSTAPRASLA